MGLSGCTGADAGDAALPAGPALTSATAAATSPPPDIPAAIDDEPAVPDGAAGGTVSPAQGTVELSVPDAVPGGAPGQVYLSWVRASLTAFARPGADDGGVTRYAAPPVVRDLRDRVRTLVLRGWAEYGSARLSGMSVSGSGTSARITACLDLSGMATRDAVGRLAGRDEPVRSTATLARTGNRWLVTSDQRTISGRCP